MTHAIERTLVLIKPDGVRRQVIGEVLSRIERKGYVIKDLRMFTPSRELLTKHYEEHIEQPFFTGLLKHMTSGPTVAAIVEGYRVIEGVRTLMGTTDPTTAAPGTVRGDLGCDSGTDTVENIVHSSDSVESAQREIALWFPKIA